MKSIFTLYKRDKLGRIQQWQVEVEGDGFRTVEGLVDGVKSTSEWTRCKGKNLGKTNATTDHTQALKESNVRIRMKKEEGWWEKIEDVDKPKSWEEPMLAEKWSDHKYIVYTNENIALACQPKLDGIRCIAKKTGLFTRNGKPITAVPHIWDEVKQLLDGLDDNVELDGELYNHDLKGDFNQISSIVRKLRPTEEQIQQAKNIVEYHLYDIDIKGRSFAERSATLSGLVRYASIKNWDIEDPTKLKFVETYFIDPNLTGDQKQKQLDDLYYEKWLKEGYEGQMIRIASSLYERRRTRSLLKRKEFMDEEFEIIDIEEGAGNRSGMMGRIKCRMKDGRTFDANARGTHDYYRELLNNKDQYIGKMATVRFQNYTPLKEGDEEGGKPRFPVMISIRDYE